MLNLSDVFRNNWYEIHECVVPVSNRAMTGSLVRSLTAKFENSSFACSKFDIICCSS